VDLLSRKVENLRSLEYPPEKVELLVFSDGSTDATLEKLRGLSATDGRFRVLSSPQRLGKPSALNRLVREATGDVLVLCDVRQVMNVGALRALIRPLSDPSIGCVSGSLELAGETGAGAYWRYERLIRGCEGRLGRMVGVSGSICAVRRSDMPALPEDILLDDMYVPLRIALTSGTGVVLAEAAQAYDRACDDEREFPRKVRTLAGNYQLIARMPELLVPGRSALWVPFVSHKVLRLVCPWALATLLVASGIAAFLEPHGAGDAAAWRTLALTQCLFYLLALIGERTGRLGALARTFVVLNVAAVVGLFRYVRGSQAVTW